MTIFSNNPFRPTPRNRYGKQSHMHHIQEDFSRFITGVGNPVVAQADLPLSHHILPRANNIYGIFAMPVAWKGTDINVDLVLDSPSDNEVLYPLYIAAAIIPSGGMSTFPPEPDFNFGPEATAQVHFLGGGPYNPHRVNVNVSPGVNGVYSPEDHLLWIRIRNETELPVEEDLLGSLITICYEVDEQHKR